MARKTKSMHPGPAVPVVERLLRDAHAQYPALVSLRRAIVAAGVPADAVPDNGGLRAIVLLGNYQRSAVLKQVLPWLPTLEAKGLLHEHDPDSMPTPSLRLFALIVDQLDGVRDIDERFVEGIARAQDTSQILTSVSVHCAGTVTGRWGQPARIHFQANGAEWILIRPDSVFGVAQHLLRGENNGDFEGRIEVPIDDGSVLIAAMSPSGDVTTHIINLHVQREEEN